MEISLERRAEHQCIRLGRERENGTVSTDEIRTAQDICSALYLSEQTLGTIMLPFAFKNIAVLSNMHDLTSPWSLPFDLLICY